MTDASGRPAAPKLFLRLGACAALVAVAVPHASGQQPAVDQTASPTEASGSNVTTYKPEFFAEFRPNTAMDMIGRIPGFQFDGGSNARGFSGTGGNVLINGERPPSRSDSLSSVLSRIPASAVERIDVIRGGAEGIDMQGKPIVANVIRKPDAGLTGAVSSGLNANTRSDWGVNGQVQLQDQRDGRLLEGAINVGTNEGSGISARRRILPSGAILLDAERQSSNAFDFISATGAYESALFGGKVRINGQARKESGTFASDETLIVPGGSQISDDARDESSGELGVRYTRDFSGVGVELVAFQSLDHEESDSTFVTPTFSTASQSTADSGESIARTVITLPAWGDTSLETGAEAVYNWTETESSTILDGQIFALAGDVFQADELRAEAFGTLTWEPATSFNVEVGGRYEWSRITSDVGEADAGGAPVSTKSEKTLSYFKPRLNLSWSPAKDHQLNLRVERLVDQLSFGAFASSSSFENQVFGIGNAEIEPEKTWLVEGRYERQFGGQTSFVAELTHRETEDVLNRVVVMLELVPGDPLVPVEITRNVGEEIRDSLDLSGSVELDKFGMPGGILNLGVDLRLSETVDPITLETRDTSRHTPYSWNFSLQQTLANGAFRWAVFVEDDADNYSWSPRSIAKDARLMFIGANITWKPAAGWTFGAGVNNILKNGNRSWSVFYNAPRNIGTPAWLEERTSEGATNFFMNLRKNF